MSGTVTARCERVPGVYGTVLLSGVRNCVVLGGVIYHIGGGIHLVLQNIKCTLTGNCIVFTLCLLYFLFVIIMTLLRIPRKGPVCTL